ncbi:MAG TPA: thioesterase family protein [Micromonosporaceae bacterium]|nr:thioesterase family protein [Micromonosporaceae bacterium]
MTELAAESEIEATPRFEGSNIGTWIGFKHVMYLVEEAVLEHLRRTGLAPRRLYDEYGLGVELVDCDIRILHALHVDDVVRTRVVRQPADRELTFTMSSYVDSKRMASATVRVLLRREPGADAVPAELARYAVPEIDRRLPPAPADRNALTWRWRVPYFYCHFSHRVQHSGYVRLMEEVVDLFLAERGISIRTMLEGRRWIPVVPYARVQVLGEAAMQEELHTAFTVEEVFKDFTYTARMDCHVVRDGRPVPTATGRITHGYAEILGRRDWRLVSLDEQTRAALRGTKAVLVGRGTRA